MYDSYLTIRLHKMDEPIYNHCSESNHYYHLFFDKNHIVQFGTPCSTQFDNMDCDCKCVNKQYVDIANV